MARQPRPVAALEFPTPGLGAAYFRALHQYIYGVAK